jgi:hypothetical protein
MSQQGKERKASIPLRNLLSSLDPAVRADVRRRFEAMVRELNYLAESKPDDVAFLERRGWTRSKLRTVFMFNCVYQIAVGPLSASARSTFGLGDRTPIAHGSDIFDRTRARVMNSMTTAFKQMLIDLDVSFDLMNRNTAGDLVFKLVQRERELEAASRG